MNEISPEDTVDILAKRVPLIEDSKELKEYMLRVINELARYRLREKVFIKDAIVTIRDLLKWTTRQIEAMGLKEALALEGYCILAERLRTEDEKQYIKTILLGKSKSDFNELAHYSEFA
jgi:midasin (ATPase involved in ribosome maturation)